MKEVKIGKSRIYILPVIHALAGEEKKVEEAFKKIEPDCIAMALPPEDLEIIESMKENQDFEMSMQHQYYLMRLSQYGKISLPPEDIITAHKLARDNGVAIKPLDVDDGEYADLLTEHVSIIALIRHSRKIKKMRKRKFRATNAEEFVVEWDREINSIKGFREIEEIRMERMVENLVKLGKKHSRILAIFPYEKYDGVVKRLERYKKW